MKKLIVVAIALVLIFCLVGCELTNLDNSSVPTDTKTDVRDIRIWTDEETGVQYIIYADTYRSLGGITPRLNADGTLYTEGGE